MALETEIRSSQCASAMHKLHRDTEEKSIKDFVALRSVNVMFEALPVVKK